jgi:hypothetical protein
VNVDQPLLKAALILKEHGPSDILAGICHNILYNNDGQIHECIRNEADNVGFETAVEKRLDEIFVQWPEYSGDIKYPVPHPEHSPMDAFVFVRYIWIEEYGATRKRLLDFIISTLQEATI